MSSFITLIELVYLLHIHLAHTVVITELLLRFFNGLDGVFAIVGELLVVIMHGRLEVVRKVHGVDDTVIVNCKVLLSTFKRKGETII